MALTTTVPLLISQQFDSEVVLANYQNGVYYNLDGSAAQIWLGLKVNRTVEEIGRALAAATGGDVTSITQQVQAFVDSMLAEGLIANGAADAGREASIERLGAGTVGRIRRPGIPALRQSAGAVADGSRARCRRGRLAAARDPRKLDEN